MYVGHTTNWDKRKSDHKFNCNNENSSKYNLKIYQMIRENGGWVMFRMFEVEKFPCNDKRGAEKRECEVMKELKSSMNTYRIYITKEELKATQKACGKQHREIIKEQIKVYVKEYYKQNTERKLKYQKEYTEKNKNKIQMYQKSYRKKSNVWVWL